MKYDFSFGSNDVIILKLADLVPKNVIESDISYPDTETVLRLPSKGYYLSKKYFKAVAFNGIWG